MARRSAIAVILLLGAAAAVASAGAGELPAGPRELNFTLTATDTADAGSSVQLSGRLGFLARSGHEAGPLVSFVYVRPNHSPNITASSLGVFYRYNFATPRGLVIPYLGGAAWRYFGDYRQSVDWGGEAEAGLRLMVAPAAAVNAQLFYRYQESAASWVANERTTGLAAGISVFF